MDKLYFIFGVHNHQPIGNFEHVIEEVYQKSYRPFLEVYQRFPSIKIAYHNSGFLWEWIEARHPEFVEQLRRLIAAGRVEMVTGGFYEPILPTIPEHHQIAQIEKLNEFIRRKLGTEPKGLWLAERVWEPQVARQIHRAGIEYVVLDDFHFRANGFDQSDLRGYYVTEEHGCSLKIFPISEQLRYAIPFKPIDEVFQILGVLHRNQPNTCVVLMDDGEKFGSWPGTHDWVYTQNWLAHFLEALESNAHWIETVTFQEYMERVPALGRAYLPTNSYMEMNEWTLPAKPFAEMEEFLNLLKAEGRFDRFRYFVRGGFWRNFLAKYRESNQMHKKMWFLSEQLEKLGANRDETLLSILKGQVNDAYWHGIFGGLYLPHLRHSVFSHLIEAEKTIFGDGFTHFVVDFDRDGNEEIIVENPGAAYYFAPALGGSLVEWDWKPGNFNLVNTLQRRPEGYHHNLQGEPPESSSASTEAQASIHTLKRIVSGEMLKVLHYDRYPRVCFLDHFFEPGTSVDSFIRSQYNDFGNFSGERYSFTIHRMQEGAAVQLSRSGKVREHLVELKKTFNIPRKESSLRVEYELENKSDGQVDALFATECTVTVLGIAEDKHLECGGRFIGLHEAVALEQVNGYSLVDRPDGWRWQWSGQADQFWSAPIHTLSQSESGFETTYQGTVLVHAWKLTLFPGQRWTTEFQIQINPA